MEELTQNIFYNNPGQQQHNLRWSIDITEHDSAIKRMTDSPNNLFESLKHWSGRKQARKSSSWPLPRL